MTEKLAPPAGRPSSADRREKPRRGFGARLFRVIKWLFVLSLLLAVAGVVVAWRVIRHYEEGLPQVSELKGNYRPPQVTRVLARDGSLLAELFTQRRTVVPIETLPAHVKLAVLAAEDAGFYEHEGLNYFGIARAFLVNFRSGRVRQGGSTITQQVVKELLLLNPERSYRRKLREAILSRRLEQELTKDEILGLYLNHIYLGHGRYGIEEAARYYFGKPAKDLSLAQAAMLAGLAPGPEIFSPRNSPQKALTRRTFVLGQMLAKGFIDDKQHDAALKEPVRLATPTDADTDLAPEAVEWVKRTLREVVGAEAAKEGGFVVHTTIDPKLQAAARQAVRDSLDAHAKKHGQLPPFSAPSQPTSKKRRPPKASPKPYEGTPKFSHRVLNGEVVGADDEAGLLDVRLGTLVGTVKLADYARYNPEKLRPSQFAEKGAVLRVRMLAAPEEPEEGEEAAKIPLRLEVGPQGALVSLDVRTREILALVGSYEAMSGGLDRATQSRRQPGSSFKPIVYSYGVATRRLTPGTLIDTDPETLTGYKPSNYDRDLGKEPILLRAAIARSVNVAAVHALEQLGPSSVITWANALGISSKLGPDLSLALGSYEVSPLEMAGAYATFASGGIYEAPTIVTRILGPNGEELPVPPRPPSRRVMSEAEAYVTTNLLGSVVQEGTARSARSLGRPLAGKTGTSNQSKDAWFVGYSTDVVTAVWTGFDDGRSLGPRETGGSMALPAWISFMRVAHEKKPKAEFPRPQGVTTVAIDPKTGLLPYEGQEDAIDEIFLEGTEPTEHAEVPVEEVGEMVDGAEPVEEAPPDLLPPGSTQPKPTEGGEPHAGGALPDEEGDEGIAPLPWSGDHPPF